MSAAFGVAFVLFGILLIRTRNFSAELHERWNRRIRWTRWATGPKAMQASRIANVVVGIVFIGIGLVALLRAF